MSTILFLAAGNPLQDVIGFFQRGGLFMYPLLACSIVAVTTIILRSFALREKNVMPLVIESEIERLMPVAAPIGWRELWNMITPLWRGSSAWLCNICDPLVQKTWKRCKPGTVTRWLS